LRKCGFLVRDEKEAVTTDSVDKFPDISTCLSIMKKVTGEDLPSLYDSLKRSIYTSCMIHYTVECTRKKMITKEVHNTVMSKAEKVFKSLGDEKVIALTLLYEGPYYLHSETLYVLEKAGYSKVVKAYREIFNQLMQKTEKEKDFDTIYGNEREAYMELYQNFVK